MNLPVATIGVSHIAYDGGHYSLIIGAWNDPEQIILPGFETCWDAWAFCICNGLDDPLPDIENNRRYTLKPPEKKMKQGVLL